METQAKMRIYVGGLGETVTEQDLRNTFSKLGAVEAVEMVRTKGRSFAYIDFLPSSDKSAAKLFSTYNGCAWKGGKLRLEKAKEHYLERMNREWAEDAKLANETHGEDDDAKNMISSGGHEETLDESTHIYMYFPMYRKVKSLPYKGTGKHKYSFQRLQAPSHTVHFCDCVEHACDINTTKGIQICHASMKDGGMNQDEINMMNSVLNKFLEREPHLAASRISSELSHHASMEDGGMNQDEISMMDSVLNNFLERDHRSAVSRISSQVASQTTVALSDYLPDDQNQSDDSTEDDNIIINAMAGSNDMNHLLESMKRQTGLHTKIARSKKLQTSAEVHSQTEVGIQKVKGKNSRNNGKLVQVEGSDEELEFSIPNRKQTQIKQFEGQPESVSMKEESGSKIYTGNTLQQREQVADKDDNLSLPPPLVPGGVSDSEAHTEAAAADSKAASVNNVVKHGKVVLESHPPEKVNEATNTDPKNVTSEKPAKGASWSQKSSWMQLVGSANNSSFSISQILPVTEISKKSMQTCSGQWTGFCNSSNASALKRKKESTEEDLDSGKGEWISTTSEGTNTQGFSKKKHKSAIQRSVAPDSNLLTKATSSYEHNRASENKSNPQEKRTFSSNPIMRTSSSMKDWAKTKAALSGSHKKKK